ncbi:hypothetical protein [Streptomyces sp. NPDC059916]|uniref:hypothetical protein n=1 Tax=Streptomyces sp. NPDC059916 TaxID=3347001 RepID=UPI00369A4FF4
MKATRRSAPPGRVGRLPRTRGSTPTTSKFASRHPLGKQVFQTTDTTAYVPIDDGVVEPRKKHADLYIEIGRIPQKVDPSKQFDPSVTN